MHLIHCHVKGYSTSLLPQIPHTGWLNGSTITSLVVANIFGPAISILQRKYIRKFAEVCVIPIILYCSPVIFSGLLKQDFALLRRSIKLICNVCGLSVSDFTNLVCERHIKASSDFAERILVDSEHPLHEELSKARCHTPPPVAVLDCFPRRLQLIVTLFYRHCHGCWLTATLN